MSTEERTPATMALDVVSLITTFAPALVEVRERLAAKMSRALWPRSAPVRVTWAAVLEGLLARGGEEVDALVQADQRRFHGEVQPATVLRMQGFAALTERIAKRPLKTLDDALSVDGPRRHLGQLVDESRALLVASCVGIAERPGESLERARTSLRMFREMMLGLMVCARAIEAMEMHASLSEALRSLNDLEAELDACAAPGEPLAPGASEELWPDEEAQGEVPPPVAEIGAKLTRLCALLRPHAEAIARAADKLLFRAKPPAAVTWTLVMETALAYCGTPLEQHLREAHQRSDARLLPDGPVESVAELIDHTLECVEYASQRLDETPAEDLERVATGLWFMSELVLVNIVSVAQICGLQELVVDAARIMEMDAMPLMERPRGDA
jgi:hypothetical protein